MQIITVLKTEFAGNSIEDLDKIYKPVYDFVITSFLRADLKKRMNSLSHNEA